MADDSLKMAEFMDEMKKGGVECYEVLTRSVAYLMERVDLVLIGAEAVVESGAGKCLKNKRQFVSKRPFVFRIFS